MIRAFKNRNSSAAHFALRFRNVFCLRWWCFYDGGGIRLPCSQGDSATWWIWSLKMRPDAALVVNASPLSPLFCGMLLSHKLLLQTLFIAFEDVKNAFSRSRLFILPSPPIGSSFAPEKQAKKCRVSPFCWLLRLKSRRHFIAFHCFVRWWMPESGCKL